MRGEPGKEEVYVIQPAYIGGNGRKVCVQAGDMRLFLMRLVPRRKRGEGTDEVYWPIQNE